MKLKILVFLLAFLLLLSLTSIHIYVVVMIGFMSFLLIPKNKYWDKTSFFILLFSLMYVLVLVADHRVASWANVISYATCPILFYRIGQFIVSETTDRGIITILSILITCYMIPLAVATIDSIKETGEIVNVYRSIGSEGLEEDALGATYYGLHASLGLTMISMLFLKMHNIYIHKIVSICCIAIAMLTTIHLVNRAALIITAVCLCATIWFVTKGRILKRIALLGVSIGAILIIVWGIQENVVVEIIDAYVTREDNAKFGIASGGGRIDTAINVVGKMFDSPFGVPNEMYAHNLWLDIIRVVGFLPFIPFVIASIINYKNLFRGLQTCNIAPYILGLNVCTFSVCMMEPVIEGSALYFYLVMLVWGINAEISVQKNLFSVDS